MGAATISLDSNYQALVVGRALYEHAHELAHRVVRLRQRPSNAGIGIEARLASGSLRELFAAAEVYGQLCPYPDLSIEQSLHDRCWVREGQPLCKEPLTLEVVGQLLADAAALVERTDP